MAEGAIYDPYEHLRYLPDGSLTAAEVGVLLDRLNQARAENERLREALKQAEPWLGYLIRVAADGWAPNEEAVLIRDREFIQAALAAPEVSGD